MINKNKLKTQKTNFNPGFTLVELLLYMGLSMILLVIISGLFISVLNIRNESIKNSSLDREGRYVMARLSHDVFSAQDIVEPANIGETSTTLQLMINSELITYRIVDNRLNLIDTSGSNLMTGENISATNFSVTKLGNEGGKNAVEVLLTTQSDNISNNKIETRDYKTLMSIR